MQRKTTLFSMSAKRGAAVQFLLQNCLATGSARTMGKLDLRGRAPEKERDNWKVDKEGKTMGSKRKERGKRGIVLPQSTVHLFCHFMRRVLTSESEYFFVFRWHMNFCAMISAESDESSTPQFAMKPSDMLVSEGDSVLLHCAANGRDRSGASPKVVWLRDGSTVDLPYVLMFISFSLI